MRSVNFYNALASFPAVTKLFSSTLRVDELRAHITTVSQENLDLGGSIRNSLLPFKLDREDAEDDTKAEDAEVRTVFERLNVWETILKRGGGGSLEAKMDAVGLSHGQLQLFSIEREILQQRRIKGKLVLMDEATSHVAVKSDANAQLFLKEAFAERTIIMIAHRLESIADANVLIDLSHGVAERLKK